MPTLWDLFGLFPACAGVILMPVTSPRKGKSFPRLCGGDPLQFEDEAEPLDFSPPVRG